MFPNKQLTISQKTGNITDPHTPPLSPSRQPQVIYIYNWQYIAVGFPSSSKQRCLHRRTNTTKYA